MSVNATESYLVLQTCQGCFKISGKKPIYCGTCLQAIFCDHACTQLMHRHAESCKMNNLARAEKTTYNIHTIENAVCRYLHKNKLLPGFYLEMLIGGRSLETRLKAVVDVLKQEGASSPHLDALRVQLARNTQKHVVIVHIVDTASSAQQVLPFKIRVIKPTQADIYSF